MKRTFPTAAAAWGSCTALCRIPARGGEHWLRGPALRRRCGRRPTYGVVPHSRAERAHIRRCRKRFIFSFRRESPGSVLFWYVMPWSLHFVFRGGPEKKGRTEKGPPARRKIPVARTPFRSACNSLSVHSRLERRCRIPPQQYRLRDAARRPCS